ncbi:MAG: alpha/beta fold hydrolase [Microbacterium sp.]
MGVTTETGEFSYLPHQAETLGVPAPSVKRLTLTLPDGRELSALRYGDGDPAVTLLHGAGLNAHTWDTTVLLLQQPALAIDLAGHGDSSWRTDADYSGRTLAPDVALALQEWTNSPQILVGQSLGGLTAAALASTHPDLVRDVVVVDITPGIDASGGPAALRAFYEGPTDFATRDELVDRAMSLGFGGTRPETERGVFLNTRVRADGRIEWKHHFAHLAAAALAQPAPDSATDATAPEASANRAILSASGWEDLTAASVPITLVRATRGFVSAADADQWQQHLPTGRVVALDATHNVQETAPGELARLVRDALDSPA